MDPLVLKKVLMGVSALSFSYLVARKYLREKSAEAQGSSSKQGASSAAAPTASSSSAAAASSAPASAADDSLPPPRPNVTVTPPAGAPALSRANSLSPPPTPSSGVSTPSTGSNDAVRRAIREDAKLMPQRPLVVCGPSGFVSFPYFSLSLALGCRKISRA